MSFEVALQKYIDHPQKYPGIVLYSDENVCIIKDGFPKAMRHLLVLPRSAELTLKHPLQVLPNDVQNYNMLSGYIEKAKDIIVNDFVELGLLPKDDELAIGTFRNTFINAGVHSIPSLRNLHIHVITIDFYSPRLKNKKHYNSFNTKFFVKYDDLEPTDEDLEYTTDSSNDHDYTIARLSTDFNRAKRIIKESPLKCSYCERTFGSSFQRLKQHLEIELQQKFKLKPEKISALKPNEQ